MGMTDRTSCSVHSERGGKTLVHRLHRRRPKTADHSKHFVIPNLCDVVAYDPSVAGSSPARPTICPSQTCLWAVLLCCSSLSVRPRDARCARPLLRPRAECRRVWWCPNSGSTASSAAGGWGAPSKLASALLGAVKGTTDTSGAPLIPRVVQQLHRLLTRDLRR
jgi:hypothetical protein